MKSTIFQTQELNYDEYVICPHCGERIYGGIQSVLDRCPTCGAELYD